MSYSDAADRHNISGITVIGVVWYKGRKYSCPVSPHTAIWNVGPDRNLPDDVYERKLYGWASKIDDKPKQAREDYKAGETVMLCAKCGGFHGWIDSCN